MRHARKCYNCGKIYSYCPDCFDDRGKPYIMATFHDTNCAEIFNTCVKFNMGLITKEEAKTLLSGLDLNDKANFREDVQKDIKVIFAENKESFETVENSKPAETQKNNHKKMGIAE